MNKNNLQKSKKSTNIQNIIYGEAFERWVKTSARLRAQSIVEAAIHCYLMYGFENSTYEKIAKKAQVTRPLIFKYFKDHEELFYYAVKLIRVHFQHFAVEALRPQKTSKDKLSAYIFSTFQWIDSHPAYASVLILYLQRCMNRPRDKDLNTQFSLAGAQRIAGLIQMGVENGEFACGNIEVQAKNIQTLIAGAFLTQVSEVLPDIRLYRQNIHDLCMSLVVANDLNVKAAKSDE